MTPEASRIDRVRAARNPSWLTASKLYASGTTTSSAPTDSNSTTSSTAAAKPSPL